MKISVHPLFFITGLLTAIFGGLPYFLICVLTALLHECGHIFCAARLGYACERIKLMPYGASAVCSLDEISVRDELIVTACGPLVNFVMCVAVAGLWWFVPITYAYTDIIFYANAAMLAINLLPAYPLDGGRALRRVLSGRINSATLDIAARVMTVLVALSLVAVYFFALKNASLLAVGGFLVCSAFEKSAPAQRIDFTARRKKRGREIKYIIMDEEATYKDALKYLGGGKYIMIQIYGDKFIDEISEDELYARLLNHGLYDKLV